MTTIVGAVAIGVAVLLAGSLPWALSAVDGELTWAADSILPALVLHSAGEVVVLTRWWAPGRPPA